MTSTVVRPDLGQGAPERTRWRVPAATAAGVGLLAVLGWALVVGSGPAAPAASGLREAGPLVEWGGPVVTLAGRIAAVGTVGTLLFAAVLLPGGTGQLAPQARRAVTSAAVWALAWAVATVLGGLLTVSRLVGVAPTALDAASLRVFLADTGAGRAVLLVAGLTAVIVVAARSCSGRGGARLLLAGALTALVVPVVLSGHSSAAEDHLTAVSTLAVHVVAASLWVGGLGALLRYGRETPATAARFSAVALVCFAVTAVSGVLAAGVVLGGTGAVLAALGTGYGALLLGKTLGLTVVGVLGWLHRRRTLPQLREGRPGAFRRLAVVEVAVLLATVALAVALAASPPPVAAAVPSATAAPAAADPMAGHDHGELSVGVLVDEDRFHVAGPVAAGSRVTVHNASGQPVTITADDGSFDVDVAAGTLLTFPAPDQPGEYRFTSAHSATHTDVLVVE
ncbi:CopD family protein [Modestobacter sp. VKM Ac-2979]|uniref:CopD family protein n=1 Tax=unclassified Modestobacter TaxID=2643866 RepID=UPI0022ABBCD5|nr:MULTISPECIES: CopD family protein [unclassified Modestobacter]MCZ2811828.1 CopD family protein [Modestobacter sp. VKM Ac-2979]MCZ2843551.1 CopD family protein [Modestobacter sp. VKM Ac-2980]